MKQNVESLRSGCVSYSVFFIFAIFLFFLRDADYSYEKLGDTGACVHTEASLADETLDEGCVVRLTTDDEDHCKKLCNYDPNCVAIEVKDDGTHCELWECLPTLTDESSESSCFLKDLGKDFNAFYFVFSCFYYGLVSFRLDFI